MDAPEEVVLDVKWNCKRTEVHRSLGAYNSSDDGNLLGAVHDGQTPDSASSLLAVKDLRTRQNCGPTTPSRPIPPPGELTIKTIFNSTIGRRGVQERSYRMYTHNVLHPPARSLDHEEKDDGLILAPARRAAKPT